MNGEGVVAIPLYFCVKMSLLSASDISTVSFHNRIMLSCFTQLANLSEKNKIVGGGVINHAVSYEAAFSLMPPKSSLCISSEKPRLVINCLCGHLLDYHILP